jgi:DNA-binding beta-propeller fold protein YncE
MLRHAQVIALLFGAMALAGSSAAQQARRFLYVAVPGAGNETEYRGVGILVYDIDNGHKFVKRIQTWPERAGQPPEHVRGIAASASARRLFVSTVKRLAAFDLVSDKIVWEQSYGGNCCDRIALSPDGATIYAPAFGAPTWHIIDAANGTLLSTIDVMGWPRQAIFSPDGAHVYLSAWESPVLSVVDARARKVVREVGPFTSFLCPFTINGRASQVFANIDGLVGFEVGDLQTGLVLDRVVIEGYQMELAEKFECPSHGIGLTADERELWVADGVDNRLHVFDATTYPPVASTTIEVRAQPRWVTFGIDGTYAYPSTGDVIDRESRKVVATLEDERGMFVHSERMLEIQFDGRDPVRAGEQAAAGRKNGKSGMQ